MVKYFLHRPIAVFMGFFVAVVLGAILLFKIPVSLLPNIDVPEIIVKINLPNTSAAAIEETVTGKLRDNLTTLEKLQDIESSSTNHFATIRLRFEQGSKMELVYISVNEKLDRIIGSLPKDLPRPQVIKVGTSDIPILRIQVIPKNDQNYYQASDLTEKVIRKRLEQLEGVSIVDINGLQRKKVSLIPDLITLSALGLTPSDIAQLISKSNVDIGSLSVKDGQFRYFVKLENNIQGVEEIQNIPIRLKGGTVIKLKELCKVTLEDDQPQGVHTYKGKRCVVVTIQKQANARMTDLSPRILQAQKSFKKDYPQLDFVITQDQISLLDQGIQNLTQDLWYGGIFCIILLFLFLGNFASPILMGLSIPVSLFLTFIFFYLFNISFNIISLSGLALGIGMLIDNSIVVLDSITRRRKDGLGMDESCIIGVRDVISPVVSNVLTTVAIYAPLIYMSGLAGALVYDQAIALSISLGVSLLVAFCLNPVMYKYLLKTDPVKLREDTKLFVFISNHYHKMITHIFKYKRTYFLSTLAVMPVGFILFQFVPITTLPPITETETMLKIDWSEPIDAQENADRIKALNPVLQKLSLEWEADIGLKQFLFQNQSNSVETSEIYYKCGSAELKKIADNEIRKFFKQKYPKANLLVKAAPNAFTQLFDSEEAYIEARFRTLGQPFNQQSDLKLRSLLGTIKTAKYVEGPSLSKEVSIRMMIDADKISMYDIDIAEVEEELKRLFGPGNISQIKRFGESINITFGSEKGEINDWLSAQIRNRAGIEYPLNSFISYIMDNTNKHIAADKSGIYKSVLFDKITNEPQLERELVGKANQSGFAVSFKGSYFSAQNLKGEMIIIFLISLLLLYFILAVQFENLVHPFLVMFTIPLGIAGAMLVLWLAGGTLNIMAGIGFIVVLGIIVDDPSLKVETINRLRAEYLEAGMKNKSEIIIRALHEAGDICLKPLLMVSLTTSLALIPVFFSEGIGNDLQKPLVYVIVGGLTVGTFFTLWFIPLAYWFITRKQN